MSNDERSVAWEITRLTEYASVVFDGSPSFGDLKNGALYKNTVFRNDGF